MQFKKYHMNDGEPIQQIQSSLSRGEGTRVRFFRTSSLVEGKKVEVVNARLEMPFSFDSKYRCYVR